MWTHIKCKSLINVSFYRVKSTFLCRAFEESTNGPQLHYSSTPAPSALPPSPAQLPPLAAMRPYVCVSNSQGELYGPLGPQSGPVSKSVWERNGVHYVPSWTATWTLCVEGSDKSCRFSFTSFNPVLQNCALSHTEPMMSYDGNTLPMYAFVFAPFSLPRTSLPQVSLAAPTHAAKAVLKVPLRACVTEQLALSQDLPGPGLLQDRTLSSTETMGPAVASAASISGP